MPMVGIGDTIGQYRLVEQLGRGGMAVVFRAYQPSLDRDVAVKILATQSGGPDFVERFRREARAVSRLRHPYILTVFDFGEQDGLAYMVGEYVPGGTLARKLGAPLPFDWIGIRLTALASALDYAHANGVIHRDVKPTNILLTADEMPILSDFGVAKLLAEGVANLTASGTVVGTPEYMSPEQAQGHEVGPASDVYSLGVVLYEMLVGRPPFAGPTPIAVALAHVHQTPPPPRSINPSLSPALEQVLLTGLAKDPTTRYQRAGDLAAGYAEAVGISIDALAHQVAVTPPSMARVRTLGGSPAGAGRWPSGPGSAEIEGRTAERGWSDGSNLAVVPSDARWRTDAHPTPDVGLPPEPSSRTNRLAVLVGPAVVLAILGAAFFAFRGQFGSIAIGSPTPVAARPAPTSAAAALPSLEPTPQPASSGQATLVAGPTLAPTVVPTSTPPAAASSPTLRLAPPPAAPGLRFLSPVNGARVPESFVVRGVRDGPPDPNQHVWLMARPRQGPDNWWANESEIQPNASGEWESKVFLGGEPGTFHRIAIGFADQSGQAAIKQHLAEQPGQPFANGLPAGFTVLNEISVEKSD